MDVKFCFAVKDKTGKIIEEFAEDKPKYIEETEMYIRQKYAKEKDYTFESWTEIKQ